MEEHQKRPKTAIGESLNTITNSLKKMSGKQLRVAKKFERVGGGLGSTHAVGLQQKKPNSEFVNYIEHFTAIPALRQNPRY